MVAEQTTDAKAFRVADEPWPSSKLDLHVTQCIREYADIAIRLYTDVDGEPEYRLREHGETRLWAIVQEAIRDAGWQLCSVK